MPLRSFLYFTPRRRPRLPSGSVRAAQLQHRRQDQGEGRGQDQPELHVVVSQIRGQIRQDQRETKEPRLGPTEMMREVESTRLSGGMCPPMCTTK